MGARVGLIAALAGAVATADGLVPFSAAGAPAPPGSGTIIDKFTRSDMIRF